MHGTVCRSVYGLWRCVHSTAAVALSVQGCRSLSTRPMTITSYTSKVENSDACVDLRSDTVTRPSAEMRAAMAASLVGDDVYGEDPTVNQLEEKCARMFGKEAALFVCSGTMGNLIAVMTHCQRGEELIVGRESHIHRWEQGNYAQIGGISANTVPVQADGTLDMNDIKSSVRVKDSHMPTTRLICLENTHNYTGGKALTMQYLREVREFADEKGLVVHMDGARVLNACSAMGYTPAEVASTVHSLQMCFSKGVGAPVGSILVGSKQFIETARRRRKALGGGWRQAGVLAAAALVGLAHATETMAKDHNRAVALAKGINARCQKVRDSIRAEETHITNIVLIYCEGRIQPVQVTDFLKQRGVLVMTFDATKVRAVMNLGVDDEGLKKALDAVQELADHVDKM